MKSKLVTRIWLFLLLVVLSWVGVTVGVMLSVTVLALCYPDALAVLVGVIIMCGAFGSSSVFPAFYVYLGPLILLVSSVIRCKSPARHAVFQTIACVGIGIHNLGFFVRGDGEATMVAILLFPIFLGAAIAWIEAKKSLSLRKLSAAILAMFVVLYALVATISWIDGRFHKEPSTSTPQRTI